MRSILLLIFLVISSSIIQAQTLPGFKISEAFHEQQLVIENSPPATRILINAPVEGFGKKDQVLLIFFALPNGNTIEQTFGKKLKKGDDWHYDIQHIGAQTRFLRHLLKNQTIVTVYLEARQKSWSMWMSNTKDSIKTLKSIVDDVKGIFTPWNPRVVLNSHSGGGRFIFSYLDAAQKIPANVERIVFIDSDYGYEDQKYGTKLRDWLKSGKKKYLSTLAYNDSVVIYNGKQLVSPTGGTWYRSRLMLRYLSSYFSFKKKDQDTLIWNSAKRNRIEIVLRRNPDNKIYHTRQVELNGFIHSMLSGTRFEKRGYAYFGDRVYTDLIADSVEIPIRKLNIPPRNSEAETGTAFMKRIDSLPLKERENEIYKAISNGNIPDLLRNTITMKAEFADSAGIMHKVVYEVTPDYLAVGNNQDFCRIPMNPYTAQKLADLFGGSLITAKISDHIYSQAEQKLMPFNYVPVGNANELVTKFEDHNSQIEKQLKDSLGKHGQLVAGIKKDVILSARNLKQPSKVVIYGWHKPDSKPIQPVYSGHVYWYVDYSHGIRLMNNQVLIDGKPCLLSSVLKDPVLYKIFSNESTPMERVGYFPGS